MKTIKIKVYLSINLHNANQEDELDTGFTHAERDAMTPDEWEGICKELLKDWAYNYIEYGYEEIE